MSNPLFDGAWAMTRREDDASTQPVSEPHQIQSEPHGDLTTILANSPDRLAYFARPYGVTCFLPKDGDTEAVSASVDAWLDAAKTKGGDRWADILAGPVTVTREGSGLAYRFDVLSPRGHRIATLTSTVTGTEPTAEENA